MTYLISYSATIIDNIFFALFLGEDLIVAIGLVATLNVGITGIMLMIPTGDTVIFDYAMGNKDAKLFQNIFSLSIIVSITLCIVCTLILFFGVKFFCSLFLFSISNDLTVVQIYSYTVEYLRISSVCALFYSIANNFFSINRIDSNQKFLFYCVIKLLVINLIFRFAFLQLCLGMQRIALFSCLAYLVIVFVSFRNFFRECNHFRFRRTRENIIKKLVSIINYDSIELISEISRFLFDISINLILVYFVGTIRLVAYSILINIEIVGSVMHYVASQAGCCISSLMHDDRNSTGMQQCFVHCIILGFILTIIFSNIVLVFPDFFLYFFGMEEQVLYTIIVLAISVFGFEIPLNAIVHAYFHYFNSCLCVAYMKLFFFMQHFVADMIFMLEVYPILLLQQAELGVWHFFILRVFFCLFFSTYLIFQESRFARKVGDKPKYFIDWILGRPIGFDSDWIRVECLDWNTSIDLANKLSEVCQTSLVKDGIAKDKVMTIVIAIEEMSRLPFEHCYNGRRLKQLIKIAFVKKSKSVNLLRFRDNVQLFNLLDYDVKVEGHCSKIGILFFSGLVTDMKYLNTLDQNNLVDDFNCCEG
ncbi:MAG: hypothetical protein HUJ51_00740 [Eggerthellaceae bacterium]|nr:hypothetical protein [Eggerthellaceae bacterium]